MTDWSSVHIPGPQAVPLPTVQGSLRGAEAVLLLAELRKMLVTPTLKPQPEQNPHVSLPHGVRGTLPQTGLWAVGEDTQRTLLGSPKLPQVLWGYIQD